MKPAILTLTLVLTVGNLAHCQDWENILFIKMEVVLEKQEKALSQLKEMQEKQGHVEGKLQEMQEKQGHIEGKLEEMQEKLEKLEKLEHIENSLQELHHEMEHLKGTAKDNQDSLLKIHQETKDCLGREDLESFKNISSAGQQELESSLRQEISGVISLLETGGIDECSEGSHNCGDYEACNDKLFNFTCSCKPGFVRNGSRCEESPCKSPAKFIEGLGCVKLEEERKSWQEMKATCQEAGGRLLQDFSLEHLLGVNHAFGEYIWAWLGVYEGKWLESGIPLEEELWLESYQTDPSRRCGVIIWDSYFLYRVLQNDCSEKNWGLCQFVVNN